MGSADVVAMRPVKDSILVIGLGQTLSVLRRHRPKQYICKYVINFSDPVTNRRLWQKYRVNNATVQDKTKRKSYKIVCYNASCPFPRAIGKDEKGKTGPWPLHDDGRKLSLPPFYFDRRIYYSCLHGGLLYHRVSH